MGPARRKQEDPSKSRNKGVQSPQSDPPASGAEAESAPPEPPASTTLIAVPVDPYVIHCQWELAPGDIESAKRTLGVGEHEYWPVLQLHDVSHVTHDEAISRPSFSVEVQLAAANWFVHSCSPEHSYRAELMLKSEDGSFAVMARSSPVQTPPSAPSNYVDEHWAPIRLQPREPEAAAPMRPVFDLPVQPPSGPPAELTTVSVRLPIDMREEVRSKLAALYGAPEPEASVPPLATLHREPEPALFLPPEAGPSRLPIDMREELKSRLSQLYREIGGEPGPIPGPRLALEVPTVEVVFREIVPSFEARPGVTTDLTEINERSFTSGISSRAM